MRSLIVLPALVLFSCTAWAQSGPAAGKGMQDSVWQLNDVVVTGQYAPQSLKQSVYQVRVISPERIKLRGATDVLGVLNSELGIRFANDATLGETDIELMGMSGQNVKILLDGIPLTDRGSNRQSLSQVDINTIERIEIVEGPMSVVYGTDALAGVINIVTKKNSAADHLSVTARVQEETAGREYNAFSGKGAHNESLSLNWGRKGWFTGAGVSRNDFGGWQGSWKGRRKEWRPKDQLLTNGLAGYGNDRFKVWYRLDYLNEDIADKGDINLDNGRATDRNYITERYTHQAQAQWQVNHRLGLNAAASYQSYRRRTRTVNRDFVRGTTGLSPDAGAQDISSFSTMFFRGTAQYKFSEKLSLQPGIEYRRDASEGQRIAGSPLINDYSFFASAEFRPLPGINIRPGLRLNKNSVYSAPPVIPSINTKFALNKQLDLRLAYARGFRAPALRELYFYFFDASHAIKGNTSLKAEYSNSFNGSLSWQAVNTAALRTSIVLSGFYNHFDNRIDIGYDAAHPDTATYVNINRFKTTGGTLTGTADWRQLQASLGFSYIGRYNRLSDDSAYNKQSPTPAFTWTPEVNANISWRFPRMGATLSLFYKYTGVRPVYELVSTSDNREVVHLGKTAAFHYADFTATKNITKYITINAGVKNLFDVTSLKNTSADVGQAHSTGGPVLMWYGRSCFLGLNFSWNRQ